ncbi:hypothetical protein ALC56_06672 [Trachymyrmex septentrionalis]|uniref:Uncharacterized protein n=1 Tax=Trachymyrmex septentrionalis TaxID=34720 RepID=A0A151JWM9_9HYME|nr:hypothetical protein ALC56_06672 [Trachymyrmex septentrionalis]
MKSEVDLFSLPSTQTSIESSQWVYYKPITSLADDSPIEFVIPGHGEDCLDLTHTMLSLGIRVESERGESTSVALDGRAKVGPVNHLLHSLFNQIDVYFNFNQDKFLINGVEVRMRLVRSKNSFCLMESKTLSKIDGMQIPSRPIQPNFSKNDPLYVEAYHTLFSGTGIHFLNEGNSISRDDYANGYTLYAFLTPDLSTNYVGHWNLVIHGSLRLEVRFEKALSVTINCIIYAEFDIVLEIDSSRQVIIDFSG